MQAIFNILSLAVSLYGTLCMVRIIFTWIPAINYSRPGQILAQICDPWLNIFSKIPFRIGRLDFSPILAIGTLTLISSVLKNIAVTGRLYFGGILASIVSLLWSIFFSIAGIFFIVLLIRLLVMIFSKKSNYYNSPWTQFDNSISPFVYKLVRPFNKKYTMSYKTALIITIIMTGVCLLAGNILINFIIHFISKIPF